MIFPGGKLIGFNSTWRQRNWPWRELSVPVWVRKNVLKRSDFLLGLVNTEWRTFLCFVLHNGEEKREGGPEKRRETKKKKSKEWPSLPARLPRCLAANFGRGNFSFCKRSRCREHTKRKTQNALSWREQPAPSNVDTAIAMRPPLLLHSVHLIIDCIDAAVRDDADDRQDSHLKIIIIGTRRSPYIYVCMYGTIKCMAKRNCTIW